MHLSLTECLLKGSLKAKWDCQAVWKRQLFTRGHSALKRNGILIYSHKVEVVGYNHIAGEWVSARDSCTQRQDLALGDTWQLKSELAFITIHFL